MADGAVSFAIENVGNLLTEEGKFLWGVKDKVEEMQVELEWMQCFLKDAERRKGESHRIRTWVSQIREATYDVEDLVERFVLKTALRNRKGVMNCTKKYAFFANHVVELHQVGSRIQAIKDKLTTLRTRMQIYGIRELRLGGEEVVVVSRRKRQEYAHVVDQNVVGLDKKITELVLRLVDVEEASVVCLHGMGGLGKTTTAKQVYGNRRVRVHFECFAWVYISQQFNQRQVWESILTQLSDNKETVKSMSDDELASQLSRLQKEKKCLMVIDDIWNSQDWSNLSVAFPNLEEDSRSKVLLTSRNEGVASHYGVYRTSLDVLDHNNSLELLKNTILFLGGPNHPIKENPSMDIHFGEMVKECAGLPLAIIVLGGILARKHESVDWERVGANIKLYLNKGKEKENGVPCVLESSYEDLPYNLKSCFLYFSLYQEDEEIRTRELMQRWIGEGFVSLSTEDEDETMEDVAEEYLNELVSRCMIQAGKRGHTGRVKTCRMHDLMRDMCISKAKEEGFAHSIKLGAGSKGMELNKSSYRRLCIVSGGSILSSHPDITPQLRSVRFHFSDDDLDSQGKLGASIVNKLKLVRVLELPGIIWTYWCIRGKGQVGNLIHLRFLKLEVSHLPPLICNLRCLQTLNLKICFGLVKIPDSLWEIEQLRHLYLPIDSECESYQQRVGNLRNLQTLVNFPPIKFDLEQNLVKFIHIRKLVIAKRWEEIGKILRSQEIVFNSLQSLSLKLYSKYIDLEAITRVSPRLYRLVVMGWIRIPLTAGYYSIWPCNLTKLVLEGSILDERHMGTLAKLQSLKVLFFCFNAFIGKKMIFHKDDFLQLRLLLVKELEELEAWNVQEGALPSLVSLQIDNCRKLKSVPDGSQFLKELKELKVKYMPYSFVEKVQEGGEDWDKVSHVSSVNFSYCYQDEVTDDLIFDMDVSIDEIVERLVDEGEGEGDDHCLASVVCLYGPGRTAAAQQVYGDSRISAHFECFAWVRISQPFHLRLVWESILIQVSDMTREKVEKMSEDELMSQLCSLYKEKRCFVVLDDDWGNLFSTFPYLDKDSKSKILYTSFSEGVASHGVYHINLYRVHLEKTWELIRNTVSFLGGRNYPVGENSSWEKIVRKMVIECGVSELAISVLGGILARKHELKGWERAGVDIELILNKGEQLEKDVLTSMLEAGYEDLPNHLKPCFLYFSLYSRGEQIWTTELIQKWIGEGLVPSSTKMGEETMEDVAEEYLNEMVSRRLIQVERERRTGRVIVCRIHDRVHDMCKSKAKEEGFAHIIELGAKHQLGTDMEKLSIRRLHIVSHGDYYQAGGSFSSYLQEISPQLSSIWFHISRYALSDDQREAALLMVNNLKLVKVLELPSEIWGYWGKSAREQICNLIHLRCLKIELPELPSSFSKLNYLQTLNLELCDGLAKIPDSLWKMEQLRHLYLPGKGGVCESVKQGVGNFQNLQTLVNFPPVKFDLQQNLVKFTYVKELVIIQSFREIVDIIRNQEIVFNRLQTLSFKSFYPEYNDLRAMETASPRLYGEFYRGPPVEETVDAIEAEY